jgi:hypothetical protein
VSDLRGLCLRLSLKCSLGKGVGAAPLPTASIMTMYRLSSSNATRCPCFALLSSTSGAQHVNTAALGMNDCVQIMRPEMLDSRMTRWYAHTAGSTMVRCDTSA